MAENASEESGYSNSHVEEEALEQHRLNGTDRKKKSTKRKAKDIEEKKSTKEKEYSSTRFLYNETPSDDEEESDRVLPSPERVKTNGNSNPRVEEEAKGTEEKSEKGKAKDIEEKKSTKEKEYSSTRFLYNETPSDDEEESERVLPSPERVKTNGNSNPRVEEEAKGTERKEKSEKGKVKDIEEKKSTKKKEYSSTRFLYNETPSEYEEESERVLPSPKKRVKTNGDSKKPPRFSKVWSDEDEISILRGMIKFKEETGHDARQNMVEFRAFILVRRLREKYEKTSVGNGNGSRTQHEVELFRLCEKIWTVGPQQVTEQPNSSGTGHPEQKKKKKQNIPEIRPHSIIPEAGVDVQTLEALMKRLSEDIGLVINSKACLHGNQKEVDVRVLDLHQENMRLILKLLTLVQEKAKSPELRDSPELLEQEVLRAYLEAKIKYTQLLLNAYTGFIKDHSDEV